MCNLFIYILMYLFDRLFIDSPGYLSIKLYNLFFNYLCLVYMVQ